MAHPLERDLVCELSRLVLADLAPQELPLFHATSAAHFDDPERFRRRSNKDEMLGFGLDVALLTPAVLGVVTSVVRFLVDEVAESAKEEASASVIQFVRRAFRRHKAAAEAAPAAPEDAQPLPLSTDQVREARQLALERALQMGVPEGTASLLADSIAGSLVVT